MTIWKYPVEVGHQTLQMPGLERVLTIQVQESNEICIWAVVRPGAPDVRVDVVLVGTGWDITPALEVDGQDTYLGTVQRFGYVWHAFCLVDK